MTRLPLALAIAAVLLLAASLGWLAHWLWRRSHDSAAEDAAHMADLAARLHAAEAARDATQAGLARAQAALAAAQDASAAAAATALAETRAELAAAMDALGAARRETAEWRAAYEGLLKEDRETP